MIFVPNAPYVVDYGQNANGYYRKWSDGLMDCWHKAEYPIQKNSNTGVYSLYLYNPWTYPVAFYEKPAISINTQSSADYAYCAVYGIRRGKAEITEIAFLRNGSLAVDTVISVGMFARGRWK